MESNQTKMLLNKVPQVTVFFWIIKVLCTTVGETFADFLNFNLGFGLSLTTIIMGIAFFIVLFFQFRATKYVPGIYWVTVVLISVFGTLVTDNLTDNMAVPLETSTVVFSLLLGLTFLCWFLSERTLSIHSIFTRKREVFYWLTILFTFALGTAVGDLFSEQLGLGYLHTGISVIIIVACVYLAWKYVKLDGVLGFWIVYILTRPLGASLGDYLSQPKMNGALGLGTTVTSIIFLVAIMAIIIYLAVTKIDTTSKNVTAETNASFRSKKTVLAQTIAVLCIFLVAGIGGYVGLSNHIAAQTASSTSNSSSSQASLAGQLSDFVKIENDMLNNVNSNDFTSVKKGADDLEHQWDTSEPRLRKIDGNTWTKIDGTIDVVLSAARAGTPNANQCKSALNNSLSILNGANKSSSQTDTTTASVDKSQTDTQQATPIAKSQSDKTQGTIANENSQNVSPQNKLGGKLADFIKIETDMLSSVNSNDFASAKKEADSLEHDWDLSEPKLRKVDGTTWTKIDGTIDVVLASARAGTPNASKCKSALNNSLSILNGANK